MLHRSVSPRSSSPECEQPRCQPVRALACVASSLSWLHSSSRSTFRQCPTYARVSARSEGGGFEEMYVQVTVLEVVSLGTWRSLPKEDVA